MEEEVTVFHVVYQPRKGFWRVVQEGTEFAPGDFPNKQLAVSTARRLAYNKQPAQIVIHDERGEVEVSYRYEGVEFVTGDETSERQAKAFQDDDY